MKNRITINIDGEFANHADDDEQFEVLVKLKRIVELACDLSSDFLWDESDGSISTLAEEESEEDDEEDDEMELDE